MPNDPSIATVHALAIQEMLNLPKLYGPNGFVNSLISKNGPANASYDGPPAASWPCWSNWKRRRSIQPC